MRSSNFRNLRTTYHHPSLTWKIRRALVEGIGPSYDKDRDEVGRYGRLVVAHTHFEKPERVRMLYRFFRDQSRQETQREFFQTLLIQVDPTAGLWRDENAQTLEQEMKKEGVIVASSASNLADLVQELIDLPENKILHSSLQLMDPEEDYAKRISESRRIKLNGARVIRNFASRAGFTVPQDEFISGAISERLYELLKEKGYSFPEGLHSGCDVARSRPNMELVALVVIRPDGNPTYIFPKDLLEGTELFYEFNKYRSGQAHMEDGLVTSEVFKYHGENTIFIPRRYSKRGEFDKVIIKYMPQLDRPRDMFLEWFGTELICDCHYSRDFRNREDRTGPKMLRYARVCDAHARAALLWVSSELGQLESPHMVYPTAEAIRLLDKIRYNWHNAKESGEGAFNLVVNKAIQMLEYQRLFQGKPIDSNLVLKPLYTCLERAA